MARIAKRDRAGVERAYDGIYKEMYGSSPPANSNAKKMIRSGFDNIFEFNTHNRRKTRS